MDDDVTIKLVYFLGNQPYFLRLMERLMGLRRIGSLLGRIYRMSSAESHYNTWHNDVVTAV